VILAIRLNAEGFDQQGWLEWLRLAPADCEDIKIDGRYDSFSTLFLVRMPVAIWNLLPDNLAYSFVGFVTSGNLAEVEPPASTSSDTCSSKMLATFEYSPSNITSQGLDPVTA
jgi:hypothetical protein